MCALRRPRAAHDDTQVHRDDVGPLIRRDGERVQRIRRAPQPVPDPQALDAFHERLTHARPAIALAIQFRLAGRAADPRVVAVDNECRRADGAHPLAEAIRRLPGGVRPGRDGVADVAHDDAVRAAGERFADRRVVVAERTRGEAAEERRHGGRGAGRGVGRTETRHLHLLADQHERGHGRVAHRRGVCSLVERLALRPVEQHRAHGH